MEITVCGLNIRVIAFLCLRRAFVQLSSSPEAFLVLRSHFTKTYATLCVCQYILGIGDRHLSNFMIDLSTGGVVGIDFGHAFGTATQVSVGGIVTTTYIILI